MIGDGEMTVRAVMVMVMEMGAVMDTAAAIEPSSVEAISLFDGAA